MPEPIVMDHFTRKFIMTPEFISTTYIIHKFLPSVMPALQPLKISDAEPYYFMMACTNLHENL
jgi:hypothetical protein